MTELSKMAVETGSGKNASVSSNVVVLPNQKQAHA